MFLTVVVLLGGGARAAPGDEWMAALEEIRPLLEQAGEAAVRQPQSANPFLDRSLAALRQARKQSAQGPFASAAQEVEETLKQARKSPDGADKEALIRQGRDQVASLRAAAQGPEAPPGQREKAKAVLQEILASKEFQKQGEGPFNRWLRRVLQWFLELLEGLFPALRGGSTAARVAMWIVGLLLFALLVFLVTHGLAALLGYLGVRSAREQEEQERGKVVRPGERPTPEGLLAEAEQRAGAGEYREALRLLYQAVLFLLDRRQLVEFDESWANWEYQQVLREQPDPWWPDRFAWATDLFEQKWYGDQRTGESDYRSFLDYFREVAGRTEP